MKKFFVMGLALLAFFQARAQVSMELSLDQDQYLPNETIRLAVKIINTSGQELHLGANPNWLTFSMESADGTVVVKNSEVPVVEPFDLESSQMATKHVDLQPYFQLTRPDRYKVIATMHIPEWGLTVNSAPTHFDIITGAELWGQDFGVTVATNAPPESRRYALIKANYLRSQLRLYAQVRSNGGANVLKVTALGPLVSFNLPEEEVDRVSMLHVLWQTGAQSFSYVILDPNGEIITRDIYDNFNSRPRLTVNDNGDVIVRGGVRRVKVEDKPAAKLPAAPPVTPAVTSSVAPAKP
jgi:hypothetical protein